MSNRNRNRIRDSNSGICDAFRKEINRYITMWNEDRITFLKEFSPYMVTGYMGDIVSKNVSSHLEAGSLEAVIDTFQEIINLTADYIPSLALKDISYGIAFALCLKLLVYAKSLDSKKFRKGDMSVVGPRPCVTYELGDFDTLNKKYKKRFWVKAGLTGLAQVKGRNDISWDDTKGS